MACKDAEGWAREKVERGARVGALGEIMLVGAGGGGREDLR
jgi:hypothetical protein